MFLRHFITSLFLFFALITTQNSHSREWMAKSGHKITGDFVSVQDGIVKISQSEEFVAEIPMDKLSEEDQKFVETRCARTANQ